MRQVLLAVLILVIVTLGTLGALLMISGPSLDVPVAPQPTATRRAYNAPRNTVTPDPCVEDWRRQCEELADLFSEATNETVPLCRVKSDEWCVERLVDLSRRARDTGTTTCGREAREAMAGVFRSMALARSMSLGAERDEMVQHAEEALQQYNEACRQ